MRKTSLFLGFIALVFSSTAVQAEPSEQTALGFAPLTSSYSPKQPLFLKSAPTSEVRNGMDSERWTWMRTNPGVKPYTFMDDMTFVGIPVFLAGWGIKGDKASFRQDYDNTHANTRLVTNFKTHIDDYTQYFGPVMTVGLKAAGYEGRSDWGRLLASSALSYGFMAAFVNGIKYTAKEMRPDGSTANSWPSGHTATSFVGATILHKEYGLTRSPWFSVAGYGVATATGVMRILNNRHWISDVLSGAGIGILSTELGYAFGDLIFKDRGLLRNDLENSGDNPSFFAISMGMGFGMKSLSFGTSDLEHSEDYDTDDIEDETFKVDFHSASVVDAEGAYFFNKYVGVGGRLRVRAMTAKSWNDFVADAADNRKELGKELADAIDMASLIPTSTIQKEMANVSTLEEYSIESDHLTEFSANVGLYFNVPLNSHFSLGSKLLIGRTLTQELDINAHYQGNVKNMAYTLTLKEGYPEPATGFSPNGPDLIIDDFSSTSENYDIEWDYMTLGGNNSTNFGTGLSLTYRYKSNFSWRLFCDYDYSRKEFTFTADPYRFLKHATPNMVSLFETIGSNLDPIRFKKKKDVNYFTVGLSFMVNM
jgi:membrane-associated phospholipid phosphatase